jgi:gas vesicle protein
MANTRVSKPITNQEVLDTLLNMTEESVSQSFVLDLFGEFDGKCKCNQYDTLKIPPGKIVIGGKPNKNTFTTTAGLWVFNKYFIEPHVSGVLGYINSPVTKKAYGKMQKKLSYALMEDRITIADLKDFLEKTQEFMKFVTVLSGSWSTEMLTLTDKIDKRKKELIKQNKEALDAGDVKVVEDMENELLKYATDYIGNDPGMDGFNSGAGGSIDNNFKNMYIMKGAMKNPDPNAQKPYNIAFSNYMDGIAPEEYSMIANSLSAGPYSRGKKTSMGGYWEKLFLSMTQHLRLLDEGSDCHTKNYVTVDLTEKNVDDWMYSWMIIGSGLVELTSQNMDKYIGKKVKFRFASMCKCKGAFCSKCAGNIWYRLGPNVRNVGIMTDVIPSTLKNIAMKAFHDSVVHTIEMDPWKAFSMDD